MDFETQYIDADIKLSVLKGNFFTTEVMFEHHMLVWLISGEATIIQADGRHVFYGNDIFLLPRNQLTTVISRAKDGLPHKSVVMHLTTERLQAYYAEHPLCGARPHPLDKVYHFRKHALLESCLASLIPYFNLEGNLPADIASIKIKEAITILRTIDDGVASLLAGFEMPGKIDLTAFMEKHYMFNMTLDRFSYLTGRSLATFRRDFKKLFHTTPQKWLTGKRLELAHYHIAEKKRRPVEVYAEVGFENLSHFSHAFRLRFGYPPNQLLERHK